MAAEERRDIKLSSFQRLVRWYQEVAVMVLSTLVLLGGFTLFSYVYYMFREGGKPVYSIKFRPRALHRMRPDEALAFFKEFDRMGETETYLFQPWIAFSERVFHSSRLNVDEAPFPTRRTTGNSSDRAGRPLVVWTFGGSTMFGWGVPDDQTISSHLAATLSRELPSRAVRVVNQGHSYHFSSQELALFQTLIRRGEHCDVAIFLDGVNDANTYSLQDAPAFSDRMMEAMQREQRGSERGKFYMWVSPGFPPLLMLQGLHRRFAPQPAAGPKGPFYDPVRKYQVNMTAEESLGAAYGITTLFFWQPAAPSVNIPQELAANMKTAIQDKNFHYIADLFNGMDPADVYVDNYHYGDEACERIAQVMSREVVAGLAPQKP